MSDIERRPRICVVVEGCYPYVVGGVSSWVQSLIEQTSYADFIIQTIVSDRSKRGKFALKLPENVIEVREIYLFDSDYVGKRKLNRGSFLTKKQYKAMRSLFVGENVDWDTLFELFSDPDLSIDDFLMGSDFLQLTKDYYTLKYSNIVFSDFLWSMRSIYLPLFFTLKTPVPDADIYHCIATGYAGVWGSMAKKKFSSPLMISEHGIYTREREEELIKAPWVQGLYKDIWIEQFYKMSRCAYDTADIVTSLFENAKTLQQELGCPASKTIVTPNGINLDNFVGIPEKPADDNYINVGAILRIAPIKDVKTMLNAFYYAKKQEPRLKMYVMGDVNKEDEYTKECLDFVESLKIEDVVFTGRVNVREYVGLMDMLILTSISEGQPMIILEGYCAKKPCIATNVGNCDGLINGESDDYGPAGVVVPVMDIVSITNAILLLAQNEPLRKKMGEIGYRRVNEKYSITMMRKTYSDLYQRLLKIKHKGEGES